MVGCCGLWRREDPEVLLEERQQLKTDIEDQLDEVRGRERNTQGFIRPSYLIPYLALGVYSEALYIRFREKE